MILSDKETFPAMVFKQMRIREPLRRNVFEATIKHEFLMCPEQQQIPGSGNKIGNVSRAVDLLLIRCTGAQQQ